MNARLSGGRRQNRRRERESVLYFRADRVGVTSTPYTIAIVGCGTAGPATALFLQRSGHRCTVFERFETPKPVGAGFLLQPTGLRVLDRLGLGDEARRWGAEVPQLVGRAVSGRPVLNLPYCHLGPGMNGLGIHRGALFQVLMNALSSAAIPVISNTEIAQVQQNKDAATLTDISGKTHGPFDLIIVSSGAQSALRTGSGLVRRDRPYRWGAVWTICEDRQNRFAGGLNQVFDGARRMAGILPVGTLPGADRHVPLASLFWSVHADDYDTWRAKGLDAWKDEFRSYWPAAEPLLESIQSIDQFNQAAYRDAILRPWHRDRIVYIGDAAHSMSPQLGQGANLALLDASTLARAIDEAGSIGEALALYSQRRKAQVRYYQFVSRWLTPVFQSHSRHLAWIRDRTMAHLCRFPPTRRMMLTTMAGLNTGFFSTIDLENV